MLTFNVISHAGYAFVSIILLYRYRTNKSLTIFNISTFICYSFSTLHHIFPAKQNLIQLDYVGIYILITGTYFSIFKDKLILVGISLISIGFSTFQIINNKVYPIGYLLAGWFAILGIPELLRKFPKKYLTTLVLGGMMYSIGEGVNLQEYRWSHEIFHIFVITGTLCHLTFVRRLSEENRVDWKNTFLYGTSRVPIGRGQLGRSDAEWNWENFNRG